MKRHQKKSIIAKSKYGFTLLELTVSLFLLGILTLLLMLILQTTINTSRNFLDYTNYEYALFHKKFFEMYDNGNKVERISNNIIITQEKEEDRIVFTNDSVYLEKQKTKTYYAGYILLLKNLTSYKIEQEDKLLHITLVDRNNHERNMYVKLKDKKEEEKKKKETEEKEKKDSDKNSNEKENESKESEKNDKA